MKTVPCAACGADALLTDAAEEAGAEVYCSERCAGATPYARPWVYGHVPADEEPDTCLLGSGGLLFGRVVGMPGHPAALTARLIVRAVNASDDAEANARMGREVCDAVRELYALIDDGRGEYTRAELRKVADRFARAINYDPDYPGVGLGG